MMKSDTGSNGNGALLEPLEVKNPLTKREQEILEHVAQGYSNQEIANLLFCSKRTVDFHLANARAKLGVTNRTAAVVKASNLGIVSMLTI